ncbi:hypothetical protein [Paenibacillus sp. FSL R7-0331]|uniref:hypothetical protein n=1 Tax=Paenibacillus sp. FSL R7-0331 TaxID=1536773 RepID=UPI000694A1B7|nr:hypothetical protein [Paenibacillus sp. FSL R7-0331]
MSTQFTIQDMMIAYSEDAVELAKQHGISLDFSENSLNQVDQILEKYHQGIPRGMKKLFSKGPSEEQITQISKIFGGYVGEVMRKNIGGKWGISNHFENALALIFSSNTEVYPPAKVNKRIINGSEDNIVFYYKLSKENFNSTS